MDNYAVLLGGLWSNGGNSGSRYSNWNNAPTHKLLRKSSVVRAKRKIKGFVGRGDHAGLTKFIASWSGHARWADTHNLVTHLENHHGIAIHH